MIRFIGAIVEPVCDVTTQSSNVTVSCAQQREVQTLHVIHVAATLHFCLFKGATPRNIAA
ncbi:hypothetical protein C5E25_12095 [Pectobacterium parmentieri]|nr:hypothetical protein C5E25_12095 [Pectobacterium parmentieri]PWD60916.1 hypothetical protein DF211_15970 [Pectobacterium parmentieri]